MTSQLQHRFSNNIMTLRRRLLVDVVFATLLQRRDLKTTTLQRRHDVVCLLGYIVGSNRNLKNFDVSFTISYILDIL